MKQTRATIVSNSPLMPGVNLMWLDAPEIASVAIPGQFVFARCSDTADPFLRRPMSIHRIGAPDEDEPTKLAILYGVFGSGTGLLSKLTPGHVESHDDHRVVMSLAMAATQIPGTTTIHAAELRSSQLSSL